MMPQARNRLVVTAAAIVLLCSGCDTLTTRNAPGTNYGQILVGSPRIDGRERLINARSEQERWLRQQLEALDKAPLGVSGAVELNSFASTAAQLGVSVDPAFKLNALNQAREAISIRQSADNERAANTLQAIRRDEILTKVNKGEMNFEQAKAEFENIGIPMPASAPTAAKQPLDAASVATRKVNNTVLSSDSDKVKPPSSDPRSTTIKSTPIEEFRQRLSDREVVRNEINDIRLDDLHDLNGNTLFRLTFDTTILPANDASAWAIVKVRIPLTPGSKASMDELRAAAEAQFLQGLRDRSEAAFRGMANRLADQCYKDEEAAVKSVRARIIQAEALQAKAKAPKDLAKASAALASANAEKVAIFRRAFGCGSRFVGSNARRTLERHLAAWNPMDRNGDSNPSRRNLMLQLDETERCITQTEDLHLRRDTLGDWATWLGQIMDAQIASEFEDHVLHCFSELLANGRPVASQISDGSPILPMRNQSTGLFHFELRSRQSIPESAASRCGSTSGKDTATQFRELLTQNLVASVYAVTPKESVQTISEIASNRRAKELLLNLNAITGAAGIAAGLNMIRTDDAFQHALRRQPLVVGFTEHGRIDGSDSAKGTCPTSTANKECTKPEELVFGWVLGPSYKLSNDGKTTSFRHSVAQRSVSAELSLPAWLGKVDMMVETSWLNEDGTPPSTQATQSNSSGPTPHKPLYGVQLPAQPAAVLSAIEGQRFLREPRVDSYQVLRVAEDKAARVLISGSNLWRATDVLIGSQRASLLTVLNDNRGVLATFDKIEAPHGANPILRKANVLSLSLVTSEGRVIAGEVTIDPKEGTAKPTESNEGDDDKKDRCVKAEVKPKANSSSAPSH